MQQLPPLGVVDARLEPQAALALAEQALAEPRGLVTTFNTSKVSAQVGQRYPTGFSYRSHIQSLGLRLRMNDGYVVAQDNGQGVTRLSFHENKRYAIIMGACVAAYFVIVLLIYFLAFGKSTPTPTMPQPGGWGMAPAAPASTGSNGLWVLIPGILITIYALAQLFEIVTAPKKVIEALNQRLMYGQAGQPGFPGQPQQGFPGQAQPGYPGQPPVASGAAAGFPPPQSGLAPTQPQAGFPPQQGAQPVRDQQGGFPPPPVNIAKPPQPPQPQPPQPQPPQRQPATPQPSAADADIDNKLRELAQLRDAGVISTADFDQAKAALDAKRGGAA